VRALTASSKFVRFFSNISSHVRQAHRIEHERGYLPKESILALVEHGLDKTFKILNLEVRNSGALPSPEPHLYVGNHVSYLDILVLMSIPSMSFVAKKEVARWPFFGYPARRLGTIFVDRKSPKSRKEATENIAQAIHEQKQSIVVFPSGTTSIDESKQWRSGAFHIAHKYNIPVQPFWICYQPVREAAYLLEDTFATHFWKLLRLNGIQAFIEYHEPIQITDPKKDCHYWWQWTRRKLRHKLSEFGYVQKSEGWPVQAAGGGP